MRIRIDPARCQKTEYCVQLAPDLFARSEPDQPTHVLVDAPAAAQKPRAREAETLCPTGAIAIENDAQ